MNEMLQQSGTKQQLGAAYADGMSLAQAPKTSPLKF